MSAAQFELPDEVEPGTPLYDLLLDVYLAAFVSGASSALGSLTMTADARRRRPTREQERLFTTIAARLTKSVHDEFARDPIAREKFRLQIAAALARVREGAPNPFAGDDVHVHFTTDVIHPHEGGEGSCDH